jgi:hypothetical protein
MDQGDQGLRARCFKGCVVVQNRPCVSANAPLQPEGNSHHCCRTVVLDFFLNSQTEEKIDCSVALQSGILDVNTQSKLLIHNQNGSTLLLIIFIITFSIGISGFLLVTNLYTNYYAYSPPSSVPSTVIRPSPPLNKTSASLAAPSIAPKSLIPPASTNGWTRYVHNGGDYTIMIPPKFFKVSDQYMLDQVVYTYPVSDPTYGVNDFSPNTELVFSIQKYMPDRATSDPWSFLKVNKSTNNDIGVYEISGRDAYFLDDGGSTLIVLDQKDYRYSFSITMRDRAKSWNLVSQVLSTFKLTD